MHDFMVYILKVILIAILLVGATLTFYVIYVSGFLLIMDKTRLDEDLRMYFITVSLMTTGFSVGKFIRDRYE